MRRTQIYLQYDLHERLKTKSRNVGVTISELIRRTLEKDIEQNPVADAKAFFARLTALASFADIVPETYVRKLRDNSRLIKSRKK